MTIRQRNTLIALAGVLVVGLVLLVVTRGGHHGAKVAAGPDTGSSSTTVDTAPPTTPASLAPVTQPAAPDDSSTTTVAASPSSTAAPTTAPPATTPTTKPPATTTPTTSPGKVVNGEGAVLQPPSKPASPKPYDGHCNSLGDQGWTVKDCGSTDTGLVWLIETKPGGASQTFVYRADTATAQEVLEALDDDANSFTAIKAVVADVAGDGHQEVGFGFHDQGSGGILAVDLVGGDGTVVVHRDYGGGSADAKPGHLDGWFTDSPATGPYTHEVIEYRSGAWRIVSSMPAATAPAGNL